MGLFSDGARLKSGHYGRFLFLVLEKQLALYEPIEVDKLNEINFLLEYSKQ